MDITLEDRLNRKDVKRRKVSLKSLPKNELNSDLLIWSFMVYTFSTLFLPTLSIKTDWELFLFLKDSELFASIALLSTLMMTKVNWYFTQLFNQIRNRLLWTYYWNSKIPKKQETQTNYKKNGLNKKSISTIYELTIQNWLISVY